MRATFGWVCYKGDLGSTLFPNTAIAGSPMLNATNEIS